MPTYADECESLKYVEHFKAMGTDKEQALLKKLQESWNAFFALKRLQARGKLPPHIRKIGPPKYWKDRKNTSGSVQCIARFVYEN